MRYRYREPANLFTLDEVRAMQPGDAFYWGSQRFVFVRLGFDGMSVVGRGKDRSYQFSASENFAAAITRIVPAAKVRKVSKRSARPSMQYSFAASTARQDGENNDCTVRALAEAFSIPYETAHQHMAAHGREKGKGIRSAPAYRVAEFDGKKLVCAAQWWAADSKSSIRMTFNQWLKSGLLPARCILQISNHVFAIVDGTVRDTFKPGARSQVKAVWEVVPA